MGVTLFALLTLDATAADANALAAAWTAHQAAVTSAGVHAPTFDAADWERLAAGKVARVRVKVEGGQDKVQGAVFVEGMRPDPLWVVILDDAHDKLSDILTQWVIPNVELGSRVLYQHLDLPWPAQDRHWVIATRNNTRLFTASAGRVWERSWTLRDLALAKDPPPLEGALVTPVNQGGWMVAELGTGSLVVYTVRTVVGGSIPDELVTRWALAQMDSVMGHVADRARGLGAHYDAEHARITRPDGSVIAPLVVP